MFAGRLNPEQPRTSRHCSACRRRRHFHPNEYARLRPAEPIFDTAYRWSPLPARRYDDRRLSLETLSYGRPSSLPRSQAPLSMERTASKLPSTRERRGCSLVPLVFNAPVHPSTVPLNVARANGHLQITGIVSQQSQHCRRSSLLLCTLTVCGTSRPPPCSACSPFTVRRLSSSLSPTDAHGHLVDAVDGRGSGSLGCHSLTATVPGH